MGLYGGIELGGTKVACMVAEGPEHIVAEERFVTTTPDETIHQVIRFFKQQNERQTLSAIGVGSFGPLELNKESKNFGYITSTPKAGWQNYDLLGVLKSALNLPIVLDTDVNAAAFGELCWGNGKGKDPFVYITVGTGIGMGGWINGKLMHGLTHPEAGHILLQRDDQDASYRGGCPFHQNCWEGLASGTAIFRRWGQRAETLAPDHPAWKLETDYISQALVNLILTLSPRRIVLGGGVMQQDHLFPSIRLRVVELLNGYIQAKEILENTELFILPPALGQRAGVLGSVALAIHPDQ